MGVVGCRGVLRLGALTCLVACSAILLSAPPDPAALNKPTGVPDRIILTWSNDPSTTQSVTWRTDTSVAEGWAEISPLGEGPKFIDRAGRVRAATEKVVTDLSEAHYHSATFTDLRPDTRYVYRVGDGSTWSPWYQFRTASATAGDPLEFLLFGDIQRGIESHWTRLVRTAVSHAPNARLAVYLGDIVEDWNRDGQWGEFFRAGALLHQTVSAFPTPGNHEYGETLTPNWRPQFTLPLNGIPGHEEAVYYLDIQGVRFISLNSTHMSPEQAQWLDEVLKSNLSKWTVVVLHYPIFPSVPDRDEPYQRDLILPVLEMHGVDLVLAGHDHVYARSGILCNSNSSNPRAGAVYVNTVSGAKMYDIKAQPWMLRKAEDTQFFSVVRVNGDELTFETRTPSGALYDRFILRKVPGKQNLLINDIPPTAERLRVLGTNN